MIVNVLSSMVTSLIATFLGAAKVKINSLWLTEFLFLAYFVFIATGSLFLFNK